MQVILKTSVEKLGNEGDVITVVMDMLAIILFLENSPLRQLRRIAGLWITKSEWNLIGLPKKNEMLRS